MKLPDVTVEVMGRLCDKGVCHSGHQTGDVFDFQTERQNLCSIATNALLPYIAVLRYGGEPPRDPIHGDFRYCCPDAAVGHVFRLTLKDPD